MMITSLMNRIQHTRYFAMNCSQRDELAQAIWHVILLVSQIEATPMSTTLAQKLQIKSGKLIVLNAPPGYAEQLAKEFKDLTVSTRAAGQAEAVLLFVNSLAEVDKLTHKAGKLVKPEGMLWIAYAKGTSKVKTDVNRDRLWAAVQPIGWQPIRQIALDEVWSAMRFKPMAE